MKHDRLSAALDRWENEGGALGAEKAKNPRLPATKDVPMTRLSTLNTIDDMPVRIDQEIVFPDKRVVPPLRPQGPRIAGTLHMSGSRKATAS